MELRLAALLPGSAMPLPFALEASSFSNSSAAARGITPAKLVKPPIWSELHTHQFRILLLGWATCSHCVRLSSTGLAICHDRDIVALSEGVHRVGEVVPDTVLHDIGTEDAVKDEELPALRRVDGKTCVGRGLDHGSLETLRDELEPGVGRFQRWSDTDSCACQ